MMYIILFYFNFCVNNSYSSCEPRDLELLFYNHKGQLFSWVGSLLGKISFLYMNNGEGLFELSL